MKPSNRPTKKWLNHIRFCAELKAISRSCKGTDSYPVITCMRCGKKLFGCSNRCATDDNFVEHAYQVGWRDKVCNCGSTTLKILKSNSM